MKNTLLTTRNIHQLILVVLLVLSSVICFAQAGELDPTWGNNGIVKTDIGTPFNYANFGKQVLTLPDSSIYMIIELPDNATGRGLTVVTKRHPDGSTDLSYGDKGYSFILPLYGSHAALQSDGKIVVAGSSVNLDANYRNQYDFAVARLNADGSIDDAFGKNGLQVTDLGRNEEAEAVAIQSDGKIVVAGNTDDNSGAEYFLVARYNTDGSLDNSFAGTQINTNFGFVNNVTSIAIQSDDKIVVAGSIIVRYKNDGTADSSFNGDGHQTSSGIFIFNAVAIQSDGKIIAVGTDFSVSRYTASGILDSTFGVNGISTTDFGGNPATATSMSIQSSDKIVVAGYSGAGNIDFAIARYNADGTPDISFSGDGIQVTDIASGNDYINSITLQNDGKLLVLGYTVNGAITYFSAARYDTLGSPDNSFNGNGLLTDHVIQGSTFYTSVAVQSDGKVVSAGYSWNGSDNDFAIARYNTDGSIDSTFSSDGKQTTDFGSTEDRVSSVAIQSDGKILATGIVGPKLAFARYNADGSPDNSFGTNGTQIIDSTTSGNVSAVQSDGKVIVVGGSSLTGRTAVTRYNTDGTVDNTFDYEVPPFDQGPLTNFSASCIAIQSDGRILVGGSFVFSYMTTTSQFALMRLKTDGSVDSTFNSDGFVAVTINNSAGAYSIVIQNDNKIILGGYSDIGSSDDFALTRFNTDGSLDTTFSSDGIVVTPGSGAYNSIMGMALSLSNDKLYAAGSGQYPGNLGVVARYFLSGSTLPVSLLNFTAALQNKSVHLQWEIVTAKNLTKFIVERSADGAHFLSIDNVPASGPTNFTSTYSTNDAQPLQGINFYRLKMVDADGKFTYSNIVAVKITSATTLQIFPNPSQNILFVEADGNNENALVQIIDGNGRKLKELKVFLNGQTSLSIDISNLAGGIYNLVLRKNERTEIKTFIKK